MAGQRFRHAIAAEQTVIAYRYLRERLSGDLTRLRELEEVNEVQAGIFERELARLDETLAEYVRDLEDQRSSIAEAGQYVAYVLHRDAVTAPALKTDEHRFALLVKRYEVRARENRPDWDAFIAEAQDDPFAIGYEVAEFGELGADEAAFDELFDDLMHAVTEWIAGL